MFILNFDADGALDIDDGVAYSYIMGGSATFVAPHFRWYVGRNFTKYVAMLVSNGVPAVRIAMMLAARAALGEASRNHPDQLPHIVVRDHGASHLLLNGAEILRDGDLDDLIVPSQLRLTDWIHADRHAVDNPQFTRVAPRVRVELERSHIRSLYQGAARMAYSILAVNGIGLITSTHHCSGPALNAAIATMKLYNMGSDVELAGESIDELARWFFHDALHPVSYRPLTQLVNADHAPFMEKVATTIAKRFPLFPGGTTHLQRAMTCRKEIWEYERYAVVRVSWAETPVDDLLVQLYDTVIGDPIQFSKNLSPRTAGRLEAALERVLQYTIALFGLYDAWIVPPTRGRRTGPTAGPGIIRLIGENNAVYQTAKEAGEHILASAPDLNPLEFLDRFANEPVGALDAIVG